MFRYLRLEISRTVRDSRYVVLALGAPIGFYLLFAALFSGPSVQPGELPSAVELMVAMATFGAMWGALSATAPRLARDRERGWLNVLRVTPLSPTRVLAARICAGLLVSGPAVVAVGITARLAHGVQLSAAQWGSGLVVLWIGTLPFVILGIAIGTLTDSATAYGVTLGLYIALAALGGLWVPSSSFPPVLLHVAQALPSYNQADLGWRIAAKHAPTVPGILVLAAWTLGLAVIAYLAGTGIRLAPIRTVRARKTQARKTQAQTARPGAGSLTQPRSSSPRWPRALARSPRLTGSTWTFRERARSPC